MSDPTPLNTKPRRVVVDTGVILSRIIFPDSTPAKAFQLALLSGPLLVSTQTLLELKTVLLRPKFDRYAALALRLHFFEEFSETVEHVWVREEVLDCRDVRDNKFLEVALSGDAKVILTGDQDLLVLHPWRTISILTPALYLESLK